MKKLFAIHRAAAGACLAFALSLALAVVLQSPPSLAGSAQPADPQPAASALEHLDLIWLEMRFTKLDPPGQGGETR